MNHLEHETSPYLLQHRENPVDWYPWGAVALQKAKAEDKPILLSIGYSACHWCHVMAHESFEDPATASVMNDNFVNIKVDREERPDIDDIYMQATLAFTNGHGGWPMTVFLTPDARPFHAGTYFPKDDRYGMPSFRRVMAAVLDAYRNRRAQVEEGAAQVAESLQRDELAVGGAAGALTPALLERAYQGLIRGFDPVHGGLTRQAPKFPGPMNLEFILRTWTHAGHEAAREAVTFTLRKMARGGIYDQVGGGFHRYSVDAQWLVPHFEKMLYDNAQLSRVYLHTWQATGDPFFREVAEQIYDYILREMTTPEGAFYSTTDADSEGEEGKFFVWTPAELRAALPPDLFDTAVAYYGVTEAGNFEGHNILNVPRDPEDVAATLGLTPEALADQVARIRAMLYEARKARVPPGLDDKILTSWNGLMLASLAEAARALDRDDYRAAAIKNAAFILGPLTDPAGRLYRTHKGGLSRLNGYLEDYANTIDGLLALYQTTFDPAHFAHARRLADLALAHFAAPDGGFFDTADDHETLIARPRSLQDNATPAGNSMMAKVLVILGAYTGDDRYEAAARAVLVKLVNAMEQYPSAFGEALNAADLLIRGIKEVVIVGEQANPATAALFSVLDERYRPNAIRAYTPANVEAAQVPPLLDYRMLVGGQPAAYVCEHMVCKRPVTDPTAFRALL
jgi:uncharacterized protein YyaL (SSP411 family)